MPPVCAGAADTRGSAPFSNSTDDDVQLLQSQLADWLTHAPVDTSVFSRNAQESGDEAIILQVRLKCLPACLPACLVRSCLLSSSHSRVQIDDFTYDAGRCDANELQQPLSRSQHHEQSRSAGQSATSLLKHSCHCCQPRPPKLSFWLQCQWWLYYKLSCFGQACSWSISTCLWYLCRVP